MSFLAGRALGRVAIRGPQILLLLPLEATTQSPRKLLCGAPSTFSLSLPTHLMRARRTPVEVFGKVRDRWSRSPRGQWHQDGSLLIGR